MASSSGVLRFQLRAKYIFDSLGGWAADCFIIKTIEALSDGAQKLEDVPSVNMTGDDAALLELVRLPTLRRTFEAGCQGGSYELSKKVERLLEFLTEQPITSTKCLVFVQRRDVAHVLCWVLTYHPKTSQRFRSAPFVGMSRNVARRPGLADLMDARAQKDVLERFRADDFDVLIATNALEEGIDVQSCNLVICFDPPANLKSFIQRRGRARQKKSTLALFAAAHDEETKIQKWQALEAELLLLCQQDRELSRETDLEAEEEEVDLSFTHPTTGAMIDADNALAHLQHFYSSLPPQPYTDLRPIFIYEREQANGAISAWVSLPDCIDISPRKAYSHQAWASEKAARKDAAFHAYEALFEAGLLNDHLLPLTHDWTPFADFDELSHGQIAVKPQLQVWHASSPPGDLTCWYGTNVEIHTEQSQAPMVTLALITSSELPQLASIIIRRFTSEPCHVKFSDSVRLTGVSRDDIHIYQQCTAVIFRSTRSSRLFLDPGRLPVLLTPGDDTDLSRWLDLQANQLNAEDAYDQGKSPPFLIRAPLPKHPVFVARVWHSAPGPPLTVLCSRLTRSHDPFDPAQQIAYQECSTGDLIPFAARQCLVQNIPQSMVLASILLPPIFYHLSDCITASRLRQECVPRIPWENLKYTMEAIRAPAANRENNYQRLEFLGDCVLKFVASKYLYSAHPAWPEGYLTKRRGHLICNERLAVESLRLGLDRYIITDQPHYRDWTLPMQQDEPVVPRTLSSKLLADVVEALIGATVVDMGMDMAIARSCISHLIPAIPPEDPPFPEKPLVPSEHTDFLCEVEELIGHRFKQRILLLEALTLSSVPSLTPTPTYQRLEFLGDAVLDLLVMMMMLESQDPSQPLSQGQMTRTRAALVNGHLLGFLCLHHRHHEDAKTVITDDGGTFEIRTKSRAVSIWGFLRHGSKDVMAAQAKCQKRFHEHGPAIEMALFGEDYPWLELAALKPEKMYSDLIESVIGAIFVDAGGRIEPCRDFLARIRLVDCVRHVIRDGIDLVHPRDQLQRLAGADKVAFNVHGQTGGSHSGVLMVGDESIAHVDDCQTDEVAVLKLSLLGSEVLRQRRLDARSD